MRIFPTIQAADAKEMRRQGELAFTMIEIAIAIGVIGFALVAIIGILPTGMSSQAKSREYTTINQDASYFMDAIRNGASVTSGDALAPSAQGLDFLTNYVQSIKFAYYNNGTNTSNIVFNSFYSGAEIIGLLTTPQNNYRSPFFSNNNFNVTATVRALSGPATEQQGGANSALNSFMAFTYNMEVMITPFNPFAANMPTTNWNIPNLDTNLSNIYYNRWLEAAAIGTNGALYPPPYIAMGTGTMQYNLFDVRVHFNWPVLQNGNVGPSHQTYRTLIGSQMVAVPNLTNGMPGWYFQPSTFTNSYPTGL
ncbi:MAG TPA: type II secretion system protein [Verrucomicrobiae bacterium]|jgi:type II secretory pathway pseudopilin PulG